MPSDPSATTSNSSSTVSPASRFAHLLLAYEPPDRPRRWYNYLGNLIGQLCTFALYATVTAVIVLSFIWALASLIFPFLSYAHGDIALGVLLHQASQLALITIALAATANVLRPRD